MKNHTKLLIPSALLVSLVLGGCSILSPLQDKAAEKVAKGVKTYCHNTDESFREKFRGDINNELSEYKIEIEINCNL